MDVGEVTKAPDSPAETTRTVTSHRNKRVNKA